MGVSRGWGNGSLELLAAWTDRQRGISDVGTPGESSGPNTRDSTTGFLKRIRAHMLEEGVSPIFLRMQEFQSRSPQPGSLIPRQEARKG